ncbi:sigma-70 family RNA polymerase sigma factor [Sorangium sp. So ce726]|uniref:RNA polymerase sigma factor n=1 Tax=Sorangium sp. So ce726 TaxID=3133319 RepID=UPI003F63AB0D
MKDPPDAGIQTSVEQCLDAEVRAGPRPPRGFAAVHAEHAGFVWATLQRFGVHPPDLEDAFQDVFVVVQRRLPAFDWACPVTTWLFAICRRVAASHRRRAQRSPVGEDVHGVADPASGPEEIASGKQARERLERILQAMDLDRRAVFVMFEIEEMPCGEIAELIGIPLGTVYSRLHAARKEFAALLKRTEAERSRRGGI